MTECSVFGVQVAKVRVVSEVVLSRHQFDTTGGADWSRITMRESDPICRQCIDIGCLVVFASVAPKRFPADVISHDQDDIRFLRGGPRDRIGCIAV